MVSTCKHGTTLSMQLNGMEAVSMAWIPAHDR
jgi:hypothetical protein